MVTNRGLVRNRNYEVGRFQNLGKELYVSRHNHTFSRLDVDLEGGSAIVSENQRLQN